MSNHVSISWTVICSCTQSPITIHKLCTTVTGTTHLLSFVKSQTVSFSICSTVVINLVRKWWVMVNQTETCSRLEWVITKCINLMEHDVKTVGRHSDMKAFSSPWHTSPVLLKEHHLLRQISSISLCTADVSHNINKTGLSVISCCYGNNENKSMDYKHKTKQ